MFNHIGTVEIIIIAVIIMVLFGANKLPEFTRSIGEASKEFRRDMKDDDTPSTKKKVKSKKKTVEKAS